MDTTTLKTMTIAELEEFIKKQQAVVERLRGQLRTEIFDLLIAQDEYFDRDRQPEVK